MSESTGWLVHPDGSRLRARLFYAYPVDEPPVVVMAGELGTRQCITVWKRKGWTWEEDA